MDPLAQPISLLMRPTFTVDLQDSLEVAARKLRENAVGILPVTENGVLAGGLTESSLVGALSAGMMPTDAIGGLLGPGPLTARASATGAEALRLFEGAGAPALVVIDDAARVLGVLCPSDLYPKKPVQPRPPLVGGMATPFGVYLTTGSIRAGVGHLALITTGMSLFGIFAVAQVLTVLLTTWLDARGVGSRTLDAIDGSLPVLGLLLGMRLLPLSGIHAAEHKVVHAIERGEPIVPSIVRRMPRVHPRCGTNLAVGAGIFMSIATLKIGPSWMADLQLLFAAVLTLAFWRPMGNLVQYYVTTKRPTERQIEMGIRSANELLRKYAADPGGSSGFVRRIVNSGMLHVIAGAACAMGLAQLLILVFGLPAVFG